MLDLWWVIRCLEVAGGAIQVPHCPPPGVLPLVEMMVPFAKMMTSVLENYNDLSQFIW